MDIWDYQSLGCFLIPDHLPQNVIRTIEFQHGEFLPISCEKLNINEVSVYKLLDFMKGGRKQHDAMKSFEFCSNEA